MSKGSFGILHAAILSCQISIVETGRFSLDFVFPQEILHVPATLHPKTNAGHHDAATRRNRSVSPRADALMMVGNAAAPATVNGTCFRNSRRRIDRCVFIIPILNESDLDLENHHPHLPYWSSDYNPLPRHSHRVFPSSSIMIHGSPLFAVTRLRRIDVQPQLRNCV